MQPDKLISRVAVLLCLLATGLPSMAADALPAAPGQRPILSNGQRPERSAPGAFKPLTITTAPFTLQGGAMPAGGAGTFTPITVTTSAFTLTGGPVPSAAPPFKPVTIVTAPFSIIGK